jgi:hypothetical protein
VVSLHSFYFLEIPSSFPHVVEILPFYLFLLAISWLATIGTQLDLGACSVSFLAYFAVWLRFMVFIAFVFEAFNGLVLILLIFPPDLVDHHHFISTEPPSASSKKKSTAITSLRSW